MEELVSASSDGERIGLDRDRDNWFEYMRTGSTSAVCKILSVGITSTCARNAGSSGFSDS